MLPPLELSIHKLCKIFKSYLTLYFLQKQQLSGSLHITLNSDYYFGVNYVSSILFERNSFKIPDVLPLHLNTKLFGFNHGMMLKPKMQAY